jgi:hypothetical protein
VLERGCCTINDVGMNLNRVTRGCHMRTGLKRAKGIHEARCPCVVLTYETDDKLEYVKVLIQERL